MEERFAKQRAEVQAELASKRKQIEGGRARRDEERRVLDDALAELDAAVADMVSAIKVLSPPLPPRVSLLRPLPPPSR